jgi:hypothetical protein
MELPQPDNRNFTAALTELRDAVARYCGRKHAHGAALANLIQASADAMRRDLPHVKVPTIAKLVECREAASTVFAEFTEGKVVREEESGGREVH